MPPQPVNKNSLGPINVTATPVHQTEKPKLPEHFNRLLFCCAYSCADFEFSSCFGCKGVSQCCCIEDEGLCCKCTDTNDEERIWCVFQQKKFEIVRFSSMCKVYRQCCCFECVCGCPNVESAYSEASIQMLIANRVGEDGSVRDEDVVPYQGLCCCLQSCYTKFPECCGTYAKISFCCFECEDMCCKCMCCTSDREKDNTMIVCMKRNCLCVRPSTVCKGVSQLFCLDNRCACPPDYDVPCTIYCLPYCTLCVNCGFACSCCNSLSELKQTNRSVVPTGAPPPTAGFDGNILAVMSH